MLRKPEHAYAAGMVPGPGSELVGATLGEAFENAVAEHGDREALVDAATQRRWTYSELDVEIDELARGLLELGIARGARIGICAPLTAEWVRVHFAAAKIGAIVVALDPRHGGGEQACAETLAQAGVAVLFTGPADDADDDGGAHPLADGSVEVVRLVDGSWTSLVDRGALADHGRLDARMAEVSFDDPAVVRYAAGPDPRGATFSHHTLVNCGRVMAAAAGVTANDRVLVAPPQSPVGFGVVAAVGALTSGACLIIPGAADLTGAAADERASVLYAEPAALAGAAGGAGIPAYAEAGLRTAVLTVGPGAGDPTALPPFDATLAGLPVDRLALCQGVVEAPVVSVTTAESDGWPAAAGLLLPHVEAQVVDERGRPVAYGVRGRLCLRGYPGMLGFWDDIEAGRPARDRAGWLPTGADAVLDRDGRLTVCGRAEA
jgi:fatty-acyl-CoA synthase